MNHAMLALFGAAIGLYALQAAGAYYQMRQYKRAVHRLHQLGNVGIGQKRGGFSFGYLVLVVCDNNGIIQTAERWICACTRSITVRKHCSIAL